MEEPSPNPASTRPGRIYGEGSFPNLHYGRDAVGGCVLARRLHSIRVHVERQDPSGAQSGRGDAQNAGTAPKVENSVSRANELLERAQAHRRCRVLARPERHSRIDLYHDLAALQPVMRPRRLDDESAADALDAEVLLPGVAPGLLSQSPDPPPTGRSLKRSHAQSQAQRPPDAIGISVCRQIPAHHGRGIAINDVDVGSSVESGRGFDRYAAGARLAEQVRRKLGVDAGDFDGEFKPGGIG